MLKPLTATAIVVVAMVLSFFQKLGLGGKWFIPSALNYWICVAIHIYPEKMYMDLGNLLIHGEFIFALCIIIYRIKALGLFEVGFQSRSS
jgi:hypothetical protein